MIESFDILSKINNIGVPYDCNDSDKWQWHTTFVGALMQHNYRVYVVLDTVFINNPQIEKIVEIGTGDGALTSFFGLWGLKKDIPVLTIDIREVFDCNVFSGLKIRFLNGDENNAEVREKIERFIDGKPCMFYCDGGYKQAEFKYWAPKLPSNSIIVAHDYGVEFQVCNVSDVLNYCIPYKVERWNEMNSQICLFKIK